MFATRVLRSTNLPPQALLIRPRSSWDILRSAVAFGWDSFKSPDKVNKYDDRVKKGIINPVVLRQSSFSGAMQLALMHELDSPMLVENKFDAKQFLDGVKPALEQYHEVQGQYQNLIFDHMDSVDTTEESTTKASDEEENKGVVGTLEDYLLKIKGLQRRTEELTKKEMEVPDSIVSQLHGMISTYMFKGMQEAVNAYVMNDTKLRYEEGSSHVHNVALLSVRASELDPEIWLLRHQDEMADTPQIENEEKGDNVAKEEGNFNVQDKRNVTKIEGESKEEQPGGETEKVSADGMDEKDNVSKVEGAPKESRSEGDVSHITEPENEMERLPVVAQVEVLYDISQEFFKPPSEEMEKADNSDDAEKERDDEKKDFTYVCVAVFEGYLRGDPDGYDHVRWKLAMTRPPEEFPFFLTAPMS